MASARGSYRGPSGRLLVNPPVCGRKHCGTCGRWRHLTDFYVRERTERGVPLGWTSECRVCKIRRQKRDREIPERRARRLETQRLWAAVQRDRAGTLGLRSDRCVDIVIGSEREFVPNAPLREAFQRSGMSVNEVCLKMGWLTPDTSGKERSTKGDTTRLERTLGLRADTGGHYRTKTTYRNAVLIARVLDIIPATVGV